MTRLELLLTIIPPFAFLILALLTTKPLDSLIEYQSEKIGKDAGIVAGHIKILTQVARSAAGIAAILPAILGFIVSIGVVVYCFGTMFLLASVLFTIGTIFIFILIWSNDFRSMHSRMKHPFNQKKEPYSFTALGMINGVVMGLNIVIIVLVLISYSLLSGSCSSEVTTHPPVGVSQG
jgi:hypothetical protein